jgi:cytochrome c peroxidase
MRTRFVLLSGALSVAACSPPPASERSVALTGAGVTDPIGVVQSEGRRLFDDETFGGNGRTCRTCHSAQTGTLSPDDVQAIYRSHPDNPLFLHDGSDDGNGNGTSRILADATILVNIALPPGVVPLDDPAATHVTLRHGIPSTLNTPALDPVLMYDGRGANLVSQARGAVADHTQHTIEPTDDQLRLISEFEQTETFFSSAALMQFAAGGAPPALPQGRTDSEKRGRRFFVDGPIDLSDGTGFCALCHSGPMLDEGNGRNPIPVPPFFVPKGDRFQSILTGELRPNGDPFRAYQSIDPVTGAPFVAVSSDPGRALQTGDFRGFPFGDIGKFKVPTLWNVKNTAPYFHNGSAKSLEEVLEHYTLFFQIAVPVAIPGAPPFFMTAQDRADIIAFLQLL